MTHEFGKRVRERRQALCQRGPQFSLRQVAERVGVTPSFLSKVERGDLPPPSEAAIKRLAAILEENQDELLALAGKLSSDLKDAILRRPALMATLIRRVNEADDQQVLQIIGEVRKGRR